MTVEECFQINGAKVTQTVVEDNLLMLARRLYNDDGEMYKRILRVLNPRVNWLSIPAGVSISYIDPSVITETLF